MGYPITIPANYDGEVKLSQNQYSESDIKKYITEYEQEYLEDMLGCELAEELIADLDVDNNPVDPKFTAIWDRFCINFTGVPIHLHWHYTDYYGCRRLVRSKGIEEMLQNFVYFHYGREQKEKNTPAGQVKNEYSASVEADYDQTNLVRMYNKGLDSYIAIQYYIVDNPDGFDYDNFEGIKKEYLCLL